MSSKRSTLRVVGIMLIVGALLLPLSNIAAFGNSIHQDLTGEALPFLRPDIVDDLKDEHIWQELPGMFKADEHFDACYFAESAEELNENLVDALAQAHPSEFNSDDLADQWGQASHAWQDFYAHSNWVDLGKTTLIDRRLGLWNPLDHYSLHDGVMMVQGEDETPFGDDSSLTLYATDEGYGVIVFTGSQPPTGALANTHYKGVISGSFLDPAMPDECPDSVTVEHGDLNKDTAEESTLYDEARALAIQQTQHEWCRLLHLTNDEYGIDGPATLMGLWVKENGDPHPQDTPCAPAAGLIEVVASVNKIKVLENEDNIYGNMNFVFALFTTDFQQSRRDEVAHSLHMWDGDSIPSDDFPASQLPSALRMCVNPEDTVALTVQAWDDDTGTDGVFDDNAYNYLIDADDHLDGATVSVAGPNFAGSYTDTSGNLEVSFTLTAGTTDSDGDGLSDCTEQSLGTNPNDADSDDDALTDGAEVNTHGTNPLDADSDDDALTDGTEVTGSNPTNPNDADSDDDGLTDGAEDANHNGALDAGETNPNVADSDADALLDGCEVTGSNATNPLDPDSDDDTLLDGVEDSNHNCTRNVGETDPNDADSDDDLLDDGLEVAHGTDPLDADSDNDGIVDGQDVEWLQHAVNAVPDSAFKGTGNRDSILSLLDAVEGQVAMGQVDQALKKLADLRGRVDGCGTAADGSDWIVNCGAQIEIRAYIDLLKSNLM